MRGRFDPAGRACYSFSTLVCTRRESRSRDVVPSEGLNSFRRVSETPFNIVYEARP